jgi:hypothetical protein
LQSNLIPMTDWKLAFLLFRAKQQNIVSSSSCK